jgi:1-acyl-sn-glycerol-3-phosphate acyltransferase
VIWLRSAIFLGLLGLAVLLYGIPISLLGRFFPGVWRDMLARSWARSVLGLLKLTCGLGYRVDGLEHLPPEPAIVLCKHQSAWETIALRAILPLPQTWVLKRELVRIPVFGWALAVYQPIAIDRGAGRRAMKQLLEQGKRSLREGRWVIIFPEGTRVAPGERKAYGVGGALLAERSGRTVVPIAHNAGVFWGRRSLLKRPGVIELRIGAPIPVKDRRAGEINQDAERWIEAVVAELPGHPR